MEASAKIADMESRLAKYQQWGNVDINKLMLQLEKKEQQVARLSNVEQRAVNQQAVLEANKEKELSRLRCV